MTRSRFLIAGAVVVAVAVVGPIPELAHRHFWAHMIQHLLLTVVAAPLFALGTPVASLLKTTRGRTRQRLAALARSRAMQLLTRPLTAWTGFAMVMWFTHFSGLYDLAVTNELVHVAEHSLYLGASVLFWTPVIAADAFTRRLLAWPLRLIYLVATLPLQSFLGLTIYSSDRPLYASYSDIADQRLGALIMWIGGDFVFVVAIALVVGAWMRADRAEAARADTRSPAARERTAP